MRKPFKQSLSAVLVLALVAAGLALLPAADSGQAVYAGTKSKALKLTKKKVVLHPGEKITIKVKNAKKKVKWTTSNKKKVRILKKKGKRKQIVVLKAGKKTGKCTIKAKIGKKTLKCKVIVKAKSKPSKPTTPTTPAKRDIPAEKITAFSVKLLQQTLAGEKGTCDQLLVSPDSVVSALSMVENGAEGETLKELENLSGGLTSTELNTYLKNFHSRLQKPDRPVYSIANSIWYRDGEIALGEDYVNQCKSFQNAEIRGAAFDENTVSDMNQWVKENTRGMIPSIIDRLDAADRIVLLNALAFEGEWADRFMDSQIDKSGKFQCADGTSKKVTMLNGHLSSPGSYIELKSKDASGKALTGTGLVKFYEGGTVAFVGVLPPKGTSLNKYINSLNGSTLVNAWKNRKNNPVDIQIPKFSYDYDTSLRDVLIAMGAGTMFGPAAELGKMTGTTESQVYIDDVLHKTHIELDENGTKAAAATAIITKAGCAPPRLETKKVYLDRPFVYALVDAKTGIPFFIGAINSL